jgi:hypothetical protein
MAVEVDVDVALLKSEIKKTYASLSAEPEKDFIFPTGRAWAEDLGYPPELANRRGCQSLEARPARTGRAYSTSARVPVPTR